MGVLDDLFVGSNGLANVLIDGLGGLAVIETVSQEHYDEETDSTVQDCYRQIVPAVIQTQTISSSNTSSPTPEEPFLLGETVVYTATISAANLSHPPEPIKSTLRVGRDRYQVIDVKPAFVGNYVISYKLTMRKL